MDQEHPTTVTLGQVYHEVRELNIKMDKIMRTMFGENGMGGAMRVLVDLQSTVHGVPGVIKDTGLVGEMDRMCRVVDGNGAKGLKSKLGSLETFVDDEKAKQKRWNLTLGTAQVITWIIGLLVKAAGIF